MSGKEATDDMEHVLQDPERRKAWLQKLPLVDNGENDSCSGDECRTPAESRGKRTGRNHPIPSGKKEGHQWQTPFPGPWGWQMPAGIFPAPT